MPKHESQLDAFSPFGVAFGKMLQPKMSVFGFAAPIPQTFVSRIGDNSNANAPKIFAELCLIVVWLIYKICAEHR